ncbi:hypothetical protein SAMN05216251_108334 [Actinacidiphila alni]|uniref:Uncharacterized protein n=1 Tax=Actinacidiphila alni TaxID=380248 RepID=A0A1I2G839_9ACTN|nr:hypothetical protein [Actinacidiphila alni]SFF13702.1 hypothetical protein SAMN05216251_108334 [Actinacidiphila alni]
MFRRTSTAAGIATVAVVGALTLSGCSGGGDGEGKKAPPTTGASASGGPSAASSASTAPTASGSTTASPGSTGAPTEGVEGVWLATEGAAKVQLVLGKGQAGLTSTHLCAGTYTDKDGVGLILTCMDGDKERTSGHGVLAGDGKTLTVRWTGGPTDTFSRTGLPST